MKTESYIKTIDGRHPDWPCDHASVCFWERCMDRATSYVTTNGTLQIYLCVLFATAIAALVTVGGSNANLGATIYGYVIPAFSLVVLMLSFNIYAWIAEQLLYLDHFGTYECFLRYRLSYEAFRTEISDTWKRLPWRRRELQYLGRVAAFMIRIPISMRDVYCYYFFIYLAAPYLSLAYVYEGRALAIRASAVFLAQFLIALTGLRSALILAAVWPEVKEQYSRCDTIISAGAADLGG